MIKSKKVKYRKDRTPQGFNYLIDLDSLQSVCKLAPALIAQYHAAASSEAIQDAEVTAAKVAKVVAETQTEQKVSAVDLDLRTPKQEVAQQQEAEPSTETSLMAQQDRSHQQIVSYEPVKEFTDTMQKLIEQHGKEKENLFKLVETFQNKVISLENKLKVESNSNKGWFKFW
jgi:hypothetical protein